MKDLSNDIKVVTALVPALYGAADANGAGVDRAGFESVTFAVTIGAEGDTLAAGLFIQVEVEDSDDGTNYVDCSAADIILPKQSTAAVLDGTNSVVLLANDPAEAPITFHFGYKGEKRYSRIVYNKEGTHTTGTPAAAVAILGHPLVRPVQAA